MLEPCPGLTLRDATEEDRDALFALHRETMQPYVDAEWGWNDDWQREYFDRKYDPAVYRIIQVEAQDAGVLVVERDTTSIYLGLIEVAPQFQGQGIGSAIVRALQAEAQATCCPLTLHVLRTNPRAAALYRRLGFKVVEEETHRIRMQWNPPKGGPP